MGRLGGVAACALTVWLAFDAGGFHPLTWNRVFVALAALALILVLLTPVEGPGLFAGGLLVSLALLTAWTALSWFWSDSPPLAPLEAQRTALYLMTAIVVVAAGRRVRLADVCAGVAVAATAASVWNLAIRLAPDWTGRSAVRTDIGQLADPVGYGNGLALLAVLGVLLALGLRYAAPALVPLAAVIGLQQSSGALGALAAGLLVYVWVSERPLRVLALAVLPTVGALLVVSQDTVVDPPPTDLLAAAHAGHRLLLVLVLLTVLQAALSFVRIPAGPRVPVAVVVALLVVGIAAAPFALRGHVRTSYWSVAAEEAERNPVLGSGAGTFVDWWLRLRPEPRSTQEAHSLYLETVAELGPLALALLLSTLVFALAAAGRLRRAAALAAVVAYAVGAAVDFHWELPAVTVPAILVGASAAVHADASRVPLRRRYAVPALAALAAAGVLALAGNAALESGDAARAVRFAPFSAEAWRLRGDYRRAVELDPNNWSAWLALAAHSTGRERASALAEARRLNPLSGRGPARAGGSTRPPEATGPRRVRART